MGFRVLLWMIVLAAIAAVNSQDLVEVQLKQGKIFAVKEETGKEGRHFYSFRNIPYAKPPIGDLRFHDPQPAGSWEGTKNGSEHHPVCPQLDFMAFLVGKEVIVGNEDCLYLNVYTPKPMSDANLPVMVLIHGDGFFVGSANNYPPLPLMNKDVVLVTMNYRLNLLGFLSSGDGTLSANLGLKDMTLSFHWIHDNIRDLGGDPTRVTLFGSGTGAISAHYHMMVPQNEDLFHRVILQSGSILSPGYLNEKPRDTAAAVGRKLECPGMSNATAESFESLELLVCLNKASAEELVKISNSFYKWGILPLLFVPSVDGHYLPKHPAELLREGKYHKVDIMAGVTRDQGALNTRPLFGKGKQAEDLQSKFPTIGPLSLYYSEEEDPLYMTSRAFYNYVGDIKVSPKTADALTEMYGDRRFVAPMDESAAFHSRDVAEGKHLYLYQFEHRGAATFGEVYNVTFGDHWISHGDDLQYLFDHFSFYPPLKRADDLAVSNIMLTMWTNFAATGNPTPSQSLGFRWVPAKGSCLHYLGIATSPRMEPNKRTKRVEFWKNMPTKQNKILYPEIFEPTYVPDMTLVNPCDSLHY